MIHDHHLTHLISILVAAFRERLHVIEYAISISVVLDIMRTHQLILIVITWMRVARFAKTK